MSNSKNTKNSSKTELIQKPNLALTPLSAAVNSTVKSAGPSHLVMSMMDRLTNKWDSFAEINHNVRIELGRYISEARDSYLQMVEARKITGLKIIEDFTEFNDMFQTLIKDSERYLKEIVEIEKLHAGKTGEIQPSELTQSIPIADMYRRVAQNMQSTMMLIAVSMTEYALLAADALKLHQKKLEAEATERAQAPVMESTEATTAPAAEEAAEPARGETTVTTPMDDAGTAPTEAAKPADESETH